MRSTGENLDLNCTVSHVSRPRYIGLKRARSAGGVWGADGVGADTATNAVPEYTYPRALFSCFDKLLNAWDIHRLAIHPWYIGTGYAT